MQRLEVGLDGVQNLVELTPDEIAELEQIAIAPTLSRKIDSRRLKMALFRQGRLASLEAAIVAVGGDANIQWQSTTIFHEDSPLVQSLIQGLGWDAETVDSIFELAYSLV